MHQQRESVIQGVPNIAKVTGLEQRQVYYMLERGLLKGAVQIGSRWYITAGNLFANFRPKGEVEIELRTLLDQMLVGRSPRASAVLGVVDRRGIVARLGLGSAVE